MRNFPFYVSGVAISVYKPITLSPVNMVGQTGNNFHYLSESMLIKEKTINPTNYYD